MYGSFVELSNLESNNVCFKQILEENRLNGQLQYIYFFIYVTEFTNINFNIKTKLCKIYMNQIITLKIMNTIVKLFI